MTDNKHTTRYSRASVAAKMEEAIGTTSIEYAIDDDHVFHLPHPFFYDDATAAAMDDLRDSDLKAIARLLLGDQYDDYKAAGGTDSEIQRLQINISLDTKDSLTNGTPTRR